MEWNGLNWEATEDRRHPGEWHVEAIDWPNDGRVFVTIFTGPCAEERAREYLAWKNEVRQAEFIDTTSE